MSNVRVNFYLRDLANKEKLEAYLASTGRSQGDVVRQLMKEVIDDERPVGSLPSSRVRTNCMVDIDLMESFRARLEALGAPKDCDARDVITILLADFIEEKGL